MKLSCSEIEKALDCCGQPAGSGSCSSCPFDFQRKKRLEKNDKSCTELMFGCVSDLIKCLKAENKNCGVKIQNQREQLKVCNEKIKEQQAEIEGLTTENERLYGKVEELSLVLSDTIKIRYKEAKSEAIKEFWNELKRRSTLNPLMVSTITGDNLLKEMGCGE